MLHSKLSSDGWLFTSLLTQLYPTNQSKKLPNYIACKVAQPMLQESPCNLQHISYVYVTTPTTFIYYNKCAQMLSIDHRTR